MSLLDENLNFVPKLNPAKQVIVTDCLTYCFEKNILFRIVSGRRTYNDQAVIFTKGRTKNDIILAFNKGMISKVDCDFILSLYVSGQNVYDTTPRTWTMKSEHIDGNAIDIELVNTTYGDLGVVMARWNIIQTMPFKDPAHYSLAEAIYAEPIVTVSPSEHLKGLERRLINTTSAVGKAVIQFAINQYKKRISSPLSL